MQSNPPMTDGTSFAENITQETQQCLDQLKTLTFESPENPPKVFINIGRPGTGKSSYVEDISGLRGYSQQSLDPVTQRCELARVRAGDEACFIMDTPGFDPEHAEVIFREIVRGLQSILAISRIAGLLYFTCINQPRFDSFDRKVLQVVHAMCGDDYIPCVTFITTFWTADRPSQQANFETQLESLKSHWRQEFGLHGLHLYQHGRGYNAEGEVTESFINWFDDFGRDQIAQHARDMMRRRYCGTIATATHAATPQIVQELGRGIPIHETAAGQVLGLQLAPSNMEPPPPSNGEHHEAPDPQSSSARSGSNPEAVREKSLGTDAQDIPQNRPDRPETLNWGQIILEGASWFFRNVNLNFDIGGPGGGMRPAMGRRPAGMGYDSLSSVDAMKASGLDSSREGRLRYAREHGIGGQPFSAAWGDAIRMHVQQRSRR